MHTLVESYECTAENKIPAVGEDSIKNEGTKILYFWEWRKHTRTHTD